MYIAILGRQPSIGIAELEQLYSDVTWFSDQTAIINTPSFDFERLGGTQKAGKIIAELPHGDWRRVSMKIVQHYTDVWKHNEGKTTLGISAYGFTDSPRDIQKTGIILKGKLKQYDVSLRLIPNSDLALSTATSHHNKLGLSDNKVELLVVRSKNGKIVVAESIGAQNITAYARRDQERPKRDAFVGMLPPKLAQIMINLAATPARMTTSGAAPDFADASSGRKSGADSPAGPATSDLRGDSTGISHDESGQQTRILDPFCGTGVILQEAALMGYGVYGTDLADKMVAYTDANLKWLSETHHVTIHATLSQGDATTTTWQQPIDAVVTESYLGQPFSAPPSPAKLTEVRGNCNHIISTFLKNIGTQLQAGTPLCIAVPAWKAVDGTFTHLPLIRELEQLGYNQVPFKTIRDGELLYYREDQIVARELLVLQKS